MRESGFVREEGLRRRTEGRFIDGGISVLVERGMRMVHFMAGVRKITIRRCITVAAEVSSDTTEQNTSSYSRADINRGK